MWWSRPRPLWTPGSPPDSGGLVAHLHAITAPLSLCKTGAGTFENTWEGHPGADNGPVGCGLFCYKLEGAIDQVIMGPKWTGSARDEQGQESFREVSVAELKSMGRNVLDQYFHFNCDWAPDEEPAGGDEYIRSTEEGGYVFKQHRATDTARVAVAKKMGGAKGPVFEYALASTECETTFACGIGVVTDDGFVVGFECEPVFWT